MRLDHCARKPQLSAQNNCYHHAPLIERLDLLQTNRIYVRLQKVKNKCSRETRRRKRGGAPPWRTVRVRDFYHNVMTTAAGDDSSISTILAGSPSAAARARLCALVGGVGVGARALTGSGVGGSAFRRCVLAFFGTKWLLRSLAIAVSDASAADSSICFARRDVICIVAGELAADASLARTMRGAARIFCLCVLSANASVIARSAAQRGLVSIVASGADLQKDVPIEELSGALLAPGYDARTLYALADFLNTVSRASARAPTANVPATSVAEVKKRRRALLDVGEGSPWGRLADAALPPVVLAERDHRDPRTAIAAAVALSAWIEAASSAAVSADAAVVVSVHNHLPTPQWVARVQEVVIAHLASSGSDEARGGGGFGAMAAPAAMRLAAAAVTAWGAGFVLGAEKSKATAAGAAPESDRRSGVPTGIAFFCLLARLAAIELRAALDAVSDDLIAPATAGGASADDINALRARLARVGGGGGGGDSAAAAAAAAAAISAVTPRTRAQRSAAIAASYDAHAARIIASGALLSSLARLFSAPEAADIFNDSARTLEARAALDEAAGAALGLCADLWHSDLSMVLKGGRAGGGGISDAAEEGSYPARAAAAAPLAAAAAAGAASFLAADGRARGPELCDALAFIFCEIGAVWIVQPLSKVAPSLAATATAGDEEIAIIAQRVIGLSAVNARGPLRDPLAALFPALCSRAHDAKFRAAAARAGALERVVGWLRSAARAMALDIMEAAAAEANGRCRALAAFLCEDGLTRGAAAAAFALDIAVEGEKLAALENSGTAVTDLISTARRAVSSAAKRAIDERSQNALAAWAHHALALAARLLRRVPDTEMPGLQSSLRDAAFECFPAIPLDSRNKNADDGDADGGDPSAASSWWVPPHDLFDIVLGAAGDDD